MSSLYRRERWNPTALHNGDTMTQVEFHAEYERAPEGFRAELLAGTVYVCEPSGVPHGTHNANLISLLTAYSASTPGTQSSVDATVILGDEDEVQPDVLLRVRPDFNGQSKNTTGDRYYVQGAPELIAEIAHAPRSIDLHLKKRRYKAAGVLEYIVVCLQPLGLQWFDLHHNRQFSADVDGIFHSVVFPGLWLHGEHVLALNLQSAMSVLNEGITSTEHEQFVRRLQSSRQR